MRTRRSDVFRFPAFGSRGDGRLRNGGRSAGIASSRNRVRRELCQIAPERNRHRILRKFSENTRHALSIRCLYMNCQQKQADIYELSAETSRPGTLKFPTIEPFLLLSPFSPRWPIPPGSSFFATFPQPSSHCERVPQTHAILGRYERRNRKQSKQQRA